MLALWGVAHAQTVTIDIDPAKAAQFGLDPDDLEGQVNSLIADKLNLGDPDAYIAKFANAAAMSTRGLGVDYASNPKKFVVGGAIGPAVSGVPFSLDRAPDSLPEGGYAFMASLMAGVNLGVVTPGDKGPLDHVVIYASGFYLKPGGDKQFDAEVQNFGVHAQVKLGKVLKLGPVAQWGGLDLTGGYELSAYRLGMGKAWPISQDLDGGVKMTWSADGDYDLAAKAGSIPLEVSTNLKVTLVTAFVGGGFDLVTSSSTSTASLGGPVSAKSDGGGLVDPIEEELGSAQVTLTGAGVGDPQAARIFGGLQANIAVLKVFGQLTYGFNQTYGANVGVRIAL